MGRITNKEVKEEVSKKLKEIRAHLGAVTQAYLAQRLGVLKLQIVRWETKLNAATGRDLEIIRELHDVIMRIKKTGMQCCETCGKVKRHALAFRICAGKVVCLACYEEENPDKNFFS